MHHKLEMMRKKLSRYSYQCIQFQQHVEYYPTLIIGNDVGVSLVASIF